MGKAITGTFAADGNSAPIVVLGEGIAFVGSTGGATFGSGTVTLQCKGPDNQWYPSGTTWTVSGVKTVSFGHATEIRLSLASATNPDIDYAIISDTPVIREA